LLLVNHITAVLQVVVTAELPLVGAVFISHSIRTFSLHQFDTVSAVAALCLEIIYLIFTIVFVIYVVHRIVRQGLVYFNSFWNAVDLLLALSSVFFFGFYIHFSIALYFAAQSIQHFPFRYLSYLDDCASCFLGLVSLMAIVKCLQVVRYSPVMDGLMTVISRSVHFFIALFVFGVVFWFAASMFVNILLGGGVQNLSTFSSSVVSVLLGVIRSYPYNVLQVSLPAWAPLFLAAVVGIFATVLFALGASVLSTSIYEMRQTKWWTEDRRLVAEWLHDVIKLGRLKQTIKKELTPSRPAKTNTTNPIAPSPSPM